jgi:hypothetical protein
MMWNDGAAPGARHVQTAAEIAAQISERDWRHVICGGDVV